MRRGVSARVFVQDARAVPVVRGQAVGGDGGAVGGGGVGRRRPRTVGLRHPEDDAAVLSAPPRAARRARPGGMGDGSRADVRRGRRRGDAAGDGRRRPDRRGSCELAPARARAGVARGLVAKRGVGSGRLRRRARGGAAVSPQGHPAAAGRRPALGGADRAAALMAAHRLLCP